MPDSSLDIQLGRLEIHFKEVEACLIDGNATNMQASGAKLQRLAVEFMQAADAVGRAQLGSPARIRRVRALAVGIASLRENLLRQLAYVDHALEIVVPATRKKATYAGSATYGNPVRQSGAFTVLSA